MGPPAVSQSLEGLILIISVKFKKMRAGLSVRVKKKLERVTKNSPSREATEPGRLEIPLTGVVDDSLRGLERLVFRRKTLEGD